MIVHLIDGTYELFRHFYGLRSFNKGKDKTFGATIGVLNGVLQMIEDGATHLGVATDHVIESFRNELWDDYKTGEGIDPVLWAQFHPTEEALTSMGVVVWPMIELEADDALASAAHLAAADRRVVKVCIWTPDNPRWPCVPQTQTPDVLRKSLSRSTPSPITIVPSTRRSRHCRRRMRAAPRGHQRPAARCGSRR